MTRFRASPSSIVLWSLHSAVPLLPPRMTGAAGVVGVHLIPHLVRRGHEVIGTTRSGDKLEQLRALGAEPVLLDGLDAIAVGKTVARVGPDAIIHEMTSLRGQPDLRHF